MGGSLLLGLLTSLLLLGLPLRPLLSLSLGLLLGLPLCLLLAFGPLLAGPLSLLSLSRLGGLRLFLLGNTLRLGALVEQATQYRLPAFRNAAPGAPLVDGAREQE